MGRSVNNVFYEKSNRFDITKLNLSAIIYPIKFISF